MAVYDLRVSKGRAANRPVSGGVGVRPSKEEAKTSKALSKAGSEFAGKASERRGQSPFGATLRNGLQRFRQE